MKYLELFENLDNKFEKINKHVFTYLIFGTPLWYNNWTSIDYENFYKYEKENWEGFSDSQIDRIIKIVERYFPGSSTFYRYMNGNSTKRYINVYCKGGEKEMDLYCLKDSWFYIKYKENYFKCDQWDGLIDSLKRLSNLN